MEFHEKLNEYIDRLSCTGRALAERSGLSAAVVSRYRSGERAPAIGSAQLRGLAAALSCLARDSGAPDMTEASITEALEAALSEGAFDFARLAENLDALIFTLGININELARSMSYDSSYISRIRSGQRRPADPEAFVSGVCSFIRRRYRRDEDRARLAALIGSTAQSLADDGGFQELFRQWLCSGRAMRPDPVVGFLTSLDGFDLNEYIRSIRFDELKVPTVPFQLPTSKTYYGGEQMKAGELDFLKTTVLSRSREPVLMCSDMPMADMAEDLDFGKKWMLGIAMMLKKGLHLNMIHNLDRPFAELMLGLESWIPLYMTGQVSPFYLQGVQNNVYCHFNYVSGGAALTGECIAGSHENGKYYLTKNREELAYYQKRGGDLLRLAKPLMDIYRSDAEAGFRAFLETDAGSEGPRHGILSAPPLHTISDGLLESILSRSGVSAPDSERMRAHTSRQRGLAEAVLRSSPVFDELYCLSREDFEKSPASLPLSELFYERDIVYSWEEYREHLRLTEEYSRTHPNYTVELSARRGFHNIQISIHEGKWAMVSKNSSPAVHFVIRHPKLRAALENMVVPVVEPDER